MATSQNNLQQEAINNAKNTYTSAQTQAAKANLDANYGGPNPYGVFETSDRTNNAYDYWQSVQSAQPDPYKSQWSGTINNLLNQIVNREEFSYDFNADPLYQQYKDQYTKQGKNAMKDTVAQVSNMTGGYGNSYAATAGSQAYQNYLEQLNNKIPELYNQAMQKYKMDTDTLMGKYNAVGSQEDREFGQWSTKYGLWQGDRNYALNAYATLFDQDLSSQTFNSNNWKDDRSYTYNMWRDSVGDDHWAYDSAYNAAKDAQDYDYQLSRDAFNDAMTLAQWNYKLDQNAAKGSGSGRGGSGRGSSSSSSDDSKSLGWSDRYKKLLDNGGYSTATPREQTTSNELPGYRSANSYQIANGIANSTGASSAINYLDQQIENGTLSAQEAYDMLIQMGIDPEDYFK